MKKEIIGIVAIIVIIGLVAVVFFGVGSSEYWEDECEFGMWQTEIEIEFADGSTKSLKIIQENDAVASVMYNDKPVSKLRWLIAGVATGEGYTKAVVDRSGVSTHWYIKSGSTTKEEGMFSMSGTTDLYIGGQRGTVNMGEIDVINKMDNNPSKYPDGTYTITFSPQGTVEYWGMPQDEPYDKKTASLPPARGLGLVVERTPTGSILVTLSSDIVKSYV